MEKKLKILCLFCILLSISIMMLPKTYVVRWMSPPEEAEQLWLTLHSYLDIRLLGMAHFFPLLTGLTAILSALFQFKKINKITIILTIISLVLSIFSISGSYSMIKDSNLKILIIDGANNHLGVFSYIGGIIITSLLLLSLVCQFINIIYTRRK